MEKVKILVSNSQTYLKRLDEITYVTKETAKHWVKNKWAKRVKK